MKRWMQRWLRPAMPVSGVLTAALAFGTGECLKAAPPPAPAKLAESEADDAAPFDQHDEVIRERYPNRNPKVERHVAQDAKGNYSNHGAWKMWDEYGQLMGEGAYRRGLRHGEWTRNFVEGEAEILAKPPANDFKAPFASTATFVDDELQGTWTILDAEKRTVLCWEFDHGVRHGTSTWYFPTGDKWREIDFAHGEVDGEFLEWNVKGDLIAKEAYVQGHRLGTRVEWYKPGVKRTEAQFLFAKDLTKTTDDWWNGSSKVEVVGKKGADERHGRWVAYYRNGQKALEGRYEHDRPTGTFVWYHPNAQKAIQGEYVAGEQSGEWNWWYPSGKIHIAGHYATGRQAGKWAWYTEAGALADQTNLDTKPLVAARSKLEAIDDAPELESVPGEPARPVPTKRRTAKTLEPTKIVR